jgi:hypothetical protein
MIEDELRATFARHEGEAPDPLTMRGRIDVLARRRRRARSALRLAAASVAVALAITGVPLVRDRLAGSNPLPPADPSLTVSPQGPATPLNLLLLGSDPYSEAEPGKTRSDTVTLVHLPADRQRVYLISLPRDLGVTIPGHGLGRLNHAFWLGGAALRGIDAGEVVGFSQPTFYAMKTAPAGGYEALRPEAADLFAALRTGTLDQFATAHPDWVLQR